MITICCCGGIQVIVHDRNEVKPSEIGCFPDLKALWSTFPRSMRLHMERVGKYADVMCRYMAENNIEDMNNRVGQDFLSVSREIFALHDIGRHYIPFALLNKVGELTPEETEFIRNHTVFARRAIRSIYQKPYSDDIMQKWEEIAVYHHERFDGTGYPRQLRGEDIPLGARICAIADAYDGIVSWKPYKKKQTTREEAVEIIKSEAGKQFQPELVEVFVKCTVWF